MSHNNYRDYALNQREMITYIKSQERYVRQIRQSDQIILEKLHHYSLGRDEYEFSLLDMGCSTGNLLRHIQNLFPHWHLEGMDMSPEAIKVCLEEPELKNLRFHEGDLLYFQSSQKYDFITLSAVFFALDKKACISAIQTISQALKPEGVLILFDYFNLFEQELVIQEISELHPEGLPIFIRPVSFYQKEMQEFGFTSIQFTPFEINLDLPFPDSYQKTDTYTVLSNQDKRLQFRGSMFQPWGHLCAKKH